jgi:putative photosynthetic complex assembly protein
MSHPEHHHEHHHEIHVPREALIAAALVILITLTTVAVFRIGGLEPAAQITDTDRYVAAYQLKFEDGSNGSVMVHEVTSSGLERLVHEVPSGEGGFIRGVLRSLARARNAQGISRDLPFVLKQQASGTLLLEDPETGQRIDLQAFGTTNIDSFRAILDQMETSP